jgi:hypothetical protein
MARGRKRQSKNSNSSQNEDRLKKKITDFYSDVSNKLKGRSRFKVTNEIRGMQHK